MFCLKRNTLETRLSKIQTCLTHLDFTSFTAVKLKIVSYSFKVEGGGKKVVQDDDKKRFISTCISWTQEGGRTPGLSCSPEKHKTINKPIIRKSEANGFSAKIITINIAIKYFTETKCSELIQVNKLQIKLTQTVKNTFPVTLMDIFSR